MQRLGQGMRKPPEVLPGHTGYVGWEVSSKNRQGLVCEATNESDRPESIAFRGGFCHLATMSSKYAGPSPAW